MSLFPPGSCTALDMFVALLSTQDTRDALSEEISSAVQDLVDAVSWFLEEEEEECENMAENIMEVDPLHGTCTRVLLKAEWIISNHNKAHCKAAELICNATYALIRLCMQLWLRKIMNIMQ